MRRRSFLALATSLAFCSHFRSTTARTPVADIDSGLMALLRLLSGDAPPDIGIRYANYARQLAALGIAETGEELDPDTWTGAMGAVMMTPMMMSVPMDPAWRDGVGFDLRDVRQMVERGPAGRAVAVVVPVNAADAAMVAETVTRRLTTLAISGSGLFRGRPYAEAFPDMVIDVTPDGAVVIDLEPASGVYAGDLIRLLWDRQLSILSWAG